MRCSVSLIDLPEARSCDLDFSAAHRRHRIARKRSAFADHHVLQE